MRDVPSTCCCFLDERNEFGKRNYRTMDLHSDDASPLLTRPSPRPDRPRSLFISPSLLEDDHKWLELHGDASFCFSPAENTTE